VKVLCKQPVVDTDSVKVSWEQEIINLAADLALNNIESPRTGEHSNLTKQ